MWTEKDKILEKITGKNGNYEKKQGKIFLKNFPLPQCHTLLAQSKLLKDSRTVTAGITEQYFIKKYNTKSFWKTLKRSFQFPRSFLSLAAACKLEEAKILTPKVLYADRFFLITDLLPENILYPVLFTSPEKLFLFAAKIAAMHNNGIFHGDLSLRNIYLTGEGIFGVIDLDGAKLYPGKVPLQKRLADAARFISSYCLLAQKNNDVEKSIASFLKYYEKTAEKLSPDLLAAKVALLMKKTDMKWLSIYLAENNNSIPEAVKAEKEKNFLPEISEE